MNRKKKPTIVLSSGYNVFSILRNYAVNRTVLELWCLGQGTLQKYAPVRLPEKTIEQTTEIMNQALKTKDVR